MGFIAILGLQDSVGGGEGLGAPASSTAANLSWSAIAQAAGYRVFQINGQQSTLLLAALGLALYALRRGHPGLAGAALALGWVKPHLLVPLAMVVPLVGLSGRAMLRMYGGFAITTMLGVVATFAGALSRIISSTSRRWLRCFRASPSGGGGTM